MKTKTNTTTRGAAKNGTTFSAEEKAAMKERVLEAKRAASKADGEADLLEKIAEMKGSDKEMAERLHALVKATAPDLESRTWYGMPAYAKDGNTVMYFKPAEKFKSRYATLGFSDKARLDDGDFWPVEYALRKLSNSDEKRIGELLRRAIS